VKNHGTRDPKEVTCFFPPEIKRKRKKENVKP
jgi:hypothetical protein